MRDCRTELIGKPVLTLLSHFSGHPLNMSGMARLLEVGVSMVKDYLSNAGQMKPPVQRVNADFTVDMLKELDAFEIRAEYWPAAYQVNRHRPF
jgi:hypothetical protein